MAALAKVQSAGGGVAEAMAAAAPTTVAPAAAAVAPKTEVAPPPKPDDKPDPATERGLRQLEQQKKKWLDEQAAAKTDYEVRVAKLAQREKEIEGKFTSSKELDGLSAEELLDRMSHLSDEQLTLLARAAHDRTAAGKADPRSQAAVQDARTRAKGGAAEAKIAELEAQIAEMKTQFAGEFTKRDNASFAQHWVAETVKAIPSDKPSFLSKQLANKPDDTRRELLAIGAELEKENGGEAPTHGEVIAEFEKRKRDSLTAMGLDPDALLAPPKAPAPEAKPVTRTLNPSAPTITRPENAPKTREERRISALAKIRASARTADQT